ncbi:uncharacterized protein TRAVEDRAFT_31957, partial [Trametes versicolor FP-101664 SS1]|uniref:uncharacterized protein n=1 Tax=Trametes versicolor (strain FP-101664) TaxID=717944 RepID=UPI0004623C97
MQTYFSLADVRAHVRPAAIADTALLVCEDGGYQRSKLAAAGYCRKLVVPSDESATCLHPEFLSNIRSLARRASTHPTSVTAA